MVISIGVLPDVDEVKMLTIEHVDDKTSRSVTGHMMRLI